MMKIDYEKIMFEVNERMAKDWRRIATILMRMISEHIEENAVINILEHELMDEYDPGQIQVSYGKGFLKLRYKSPPHKGGRRGRQILCISIP